MANSNTHFYSKMEILVILPRFGPLSQRGGRRFAGRGVSCKLSHISEGWPALRGTGYVACISSGRGVNSYNNLELARIFLQLKQLLELFSDSFIRGE